MSESSNNENDLATVSFTFCILFVMNNAQGNNALRTVQLKNMKRKMKKKNIGSLRKVPGFPRTTI